MSSGRTPATPPELNGFTYVSLLGTGGYSDVFLYEQARPRRPVAVKVLLAGGLNDDTRRDQFSAEADLMAQVSAHPYIVNIFDADVADDGRPYLVMEYYPRPHLGVRAKTEKLSVPEVLRIGIQVAGAVETAHRLGILHRDIKPANILTSQYGRPGLTDFGISANTGARTAQDDPGGMSIPWTAPEVFRPEVDPDERSDVYALGATVWHLLRGRSPFDVPGGDNRPLAMMRRVENDPVPSTRRDDVPASLERTLEQAMRKRPAGRFASVFDFARALQGVQQELGLAVTPIEIPDAEIAASRPRGDGADDDATRFKPRSVDAQRKPRAAEVAKPGRRRARSAPAAATRVEETISRPAEAAAPDGESENARGRWSRRRGLLVGGLIVTAAMATIAFSLADRSAGREDLADVIPSRAPQPQDVAGAFVPSVDGSAVLASPTLARFTWTSPDPRPGDFYLITRTDDGPGDRPRSARQDAASYELKGDVGARPCIEVVAVRSSGQASKAEEFCAQPAT